MVRSMWLDRSQPNARFKSRAIIFCTCGTVSAGVRIFSPPGLLREEPGRDQGQRLMMMPTLPRPYLIVRQPRLALGAMQHLFDSMLRLEHPSEFFHGRGQDLVRQQVIVLPCPVRLLLA